MNKKFGDLKFVDFHTDHRLPTNDIRCPACKNKLTGASGGPETGPKAGDPAICSYCGQISLYAGSGRDIRMEAVAPEELATWPDDFRNEVMRVSAMFRMFAMERAGLLETTFTPIRITMEQFAAVPPNAPFAYGISYNSPEFLYMTNNPTYLGARLIWVAMKGGNNDWGIYSHWEFHGMEHVLTNGDKISRREFIRKLVDVDPELLAKYRD